MAKLVIKDLVESKELDRSAMKAISGGLGMIFSKAARIQ